MTKKDIQIVKFSEDIFGVNNVDTTATVTYGIHDDNVLSIVKVINDYSHFVSVGDNKKVIRELVTRHNELTSPEDKHLLRNLIMRNTNYGASLQHTITSIDKFETKLKKYPDDVVPSTIICTSDIDTIRGINGDPYEASVISSHTILKSSGNTVLTSEKEKNSPYEYLVMLIETLGVVNDLVGDLVKGDDVTHNTLNNQVQAITTGRAFASVYVSQINGDYSTTASYDLEEYRAVNSMVSVLTMILQGEKPEQILDIANMSSNVFAPKHARFDTAKNTHGEALIEEASRIIIKKFMDTLPVIHYRNYHMDKLPSTVVSVGLSGEVTLNAQRFKLLLLSLYVGDSVLDLDKIDIYIKALEKAVHPMTHLTCVDTNVLKMVGHVGEVYSSVTSQYLVKEDEPSQNSVQTTMLQLLSTLVTSSDVNDNTLVWLPFNVVSPETHILAELSNLRRDSTFLITVNKYLPYTYGETTSEIMDAIQSFVKDTVKEWEKSKCVDPFVPYSKIVTFIQNYVKFMSTEDVTIHEKPYKDIRLVTPGYVYEVLYGITNDKLGSNEVYNVGHTNNTVLKKTVNVSKENPLTTNKTTETKRRDTSKGPMRSVLGSLGLR